MSYLTKIETKDQRVGKDINEAKKVVLSEEKALKTHQNNTVARGGEDFRYNKQKTNIKLNLIWQYRQFH